MSLQHLIPPEHASDQNREKSFLRFKSLLDELNEKEIPEKVESEINLLIIDVNAAPSAKIFEKRLKLNHQKVITLVEKRLKLAPKNYYRNIWLALGMTVFGLPLGVAFAISMDNLALMTIGLPIGMAIGLAIGSGMDKKAFEEGRQLKLDGKS